MHPLDWHGMWVPSRPPWEVALRAAIIYLFVQVLFRVVGRKELGRYSTFDITVLFLITVAARQTIVGDDKSLTTAMVGLVTIVGLDGLLSFLTARSARAAKLLQGGVVQLMRNGELLSDALKRTRVTTDQLLAAARQHGLSSLTQVRDAFLERSGRLSIIPAGA